MDAEQEMVISLIEKDPRTSPKCLQMTMNLSAERAKELCHWAWNIRAKKFFSYRISGLSLAEFEETCCG